MWGLRLMCLMWSVGCSSNSNRINCRNCGSDPDLRSHCVCIDGNCKSFYRMHVVVVVVVMMMVVIAMMLMLFVVAIAAVPVQNSRTKLIHIIISLYPYIYCQINY